MPASSAVAVEDGDFGADYKTLKVVGKGGSATVYKGILTSSDRLVAIKQIDTDGLNKEQILNIQAEIDTIKVLSHEHIVSYLGTRTLKSKILIFLEYADRGSLRQFYQRRGELTEPQAANCTRQIIKGLSYLHENGIAHRDIKCANCLLTKGGIIKLGDFGASKRFESESVVSGLKGTPHWMAPEVIKGTQMTTGWMKADVWSLGCTVVEMVTGRLPYSEYDNPMTAMFHIANGQQPPLHDAPVSDDLKAFICACCDVNPDLRPTAPILFAMPYPSRHNKPRRNSMSNSKEGTPQGSPSSAYSKDKKGGVCSHTTPSNDKEEVDGDMRFTGETPEILASASHGGNASGTGLGMHSRRSTVSPVPYALTSTGKCGTDSQVSDVANIAADNALRQKTGSDTGSHVATATEELVEPPAAFGGPAAETGAGAGAGTGTGTVRNKGEGSFSLEQMIQDAEMLQAQNNSKTELQTRNYAQSVAQPQSILQKEEGSFSLEQMIQDAKRLQAQKNADSHRSEASDGARTAVTSTYADNDNDSTSYNNYDDEGEEDADGADSDLDLDGYNPADERGSQLSLSQQDGRLSGSGNSALFGGGSGSGATSRDQSDQSASTGMERERGGHADNSAETDRVEYVPKISSTDPNRRPRPERPSNKPTAGGTRDSYGNQRSSDGTGSLHASTTSVATLPAGSHIEIPDEDYNMGYNMSYNGESYTSNGNGGNTIGIGFVQYANASEAITPAMSHGKQTKFFPNEPAPALLSQQYPAAYYSSYEQPGTGATQMHVQTSNDSSNNSYGSNGGDRHFVDGPHPSAEPRDLGSRRNKLPVGLSGSHSHQYDSSVYGHGSHSEEYAATTSANVSRGGSIEGRPSAVAPSVRLGSSNSAARISPGVSPGASMESFERAGSGGGAAIRRQAMQELNCSKAGAAGGGGGGINASLPDAYTGMVSQGQWQQQLQQKRITKKGLRSKSANAAGPTAIPFNLAASRLPPMAAISSMNSGNDGVGSEHTATDGANSMSQFQSGSSTRIGLGQNRGIAHGIPGMNPMVPLGGQGQGKVINLSGTIGASGLGSIGMPVDYSSRGIHSAPSVSRAENFALPPIQATMTPTNKAKVVKPKTFLSNSSEGTQNYR